MNNKLQYWIELNRVKLFYKKAHILIEHKPISGFALGLQNA